MITTHSFKDVDLTILGISGFLFVLGLLSALIAVPWRIKRWRESGALELNVLWPTRTLLAVSIAFWMICQTLRLDNIWGSNSIILPSYTAQWLAQGWLCRVYLTATLGVTAPLVAFISLQILATGVRRQQVGELEMASPSLHQTTTNIRVLLYSLVCALPVIILQIAVAWISVWVKDNGEQFEAQPESVLAYFFGPFWYAANPQKQCTVLTNTAVGMNCALCSFPAAAVIIHGIWSLAFVIALWVLYGKLTIKASNMAIARKLLLFCSLVTSFSATGVGVLGASVAFSPFSWVNQGLWIAHYITAACTAFITVIFMTIVPSVSLRYISRNMHKYSDKLHDPHNNHSNYHYEINSSTPPVAFITTRTTPTAINNNTLDYNPYSLVPPSPVTATRGLGALWGYQTSSTKELYPSSHSTPKRPVLPPPSASSSSTNNGVSPPGSMPFAYAPPFSEPTGSDLSFSPTPISPSFFSPASASFSMNAHPQYQYQPQHLHRPRTATAGTSSSFGSGGSAYSPTHHRPTSSSSMHHYQHQRGTSQGSSPVRGALRRPTTSSMHHHHHAFHGGALSPSGGSGGDVRHGVVDTNPISNPLWFNAGLPPSYGHHHGVSSSVVHHSPTGSFG